MMEHVLCRRGCNGGGRGCWVFGSPNGSRRVVSAGGRPTSSPATLGDGRPGQCTDCSGTGVGYLTLQNCALGNTLTNCNFVSFSYSSNLTTFTITLSNFASLNGSLPTSLPSAAAVAILSTNPSQALLTQVSGQWVVGTPQDFGGTSTWSLRSTGVPAMRRIQRGRGPTRTAPWRWRRPQPRSF